MEKSKATGSFRVEGPYSDADIAKLHPGHSVNESVEEFLESRVADGLVVIGASMDANGHWRFVFKGSK